jgi:hypothetical protein
LNQPAAAQDRQESSHEGDSYDVEIDQQMSEQKPMEQIPRDGNYSEAEDKSLQDSDSDDSKVSEELDQ